MVSPAESDDGHGGFGRRVLVVVTVLSVAAATTGLFAVVDSQAEPSRPRSVAPDREVGPGGIGGRAPDFSLSTLETTQARLSAYRGRAVVVTFFASWCHPCEQEMPLLEAASRRTDDDLQVLAVSYEESPEVSGAFVDELGVTFPVLVDRDGSVARAYGVRAIPQTFFIDTNGVIRDRVFGITTAEALRTPLDALLHASA